MNKKGAIPAWVWIVVAIGAIALFGTQIQTGIQSFMAGVGVEVPGVPVVAPSKAYCGDDGKYELSLRNKNPMNISGAEWFAVDFYLTSEGKNLGTASSGTNSTFTIFGTDQPCTGANNEVLSYQLCPMPTDGAEGDHSKVLTTDVGKVTSDGCIEFFADRDPLQITMEMEQHGVLEFRGFDTTWTSLYNATSNDASAWILNPINLTTTTTNKTATAVGTDGEYEVQLWIRVNSAVDQDFEDHDILIFSQEGTLNLWDKQGPTLILTGQAGLEEKKVDGTPGRNACYLNADEQLAYSEFEHCYKISATSIKNVPKAEMYIRYKASAGQNPSESPQLAFATRGRYLSIDGVTTKVGAVKDDASRTQVFTLQRVNLWIS